MRAMQNYKIIVAYDGTDFHGWQVQLSDVTVVSTLQNSFFQAFRRKVSILGASRTDAGVHALGQVALCTADLPLEPEKLREVWNNALPKSIVVRFLEKVPDNFNPFANVLSKTYYYHLFTKRPLPIVSRYGWLWKSIDLVDFEKFERTLHLFVGQHDFRSFSKNEEGRTTVRTINSIKIKRFKRFGVVRVEIRGKGFLRYQIRRMIGAALDVASKPGVSIDVITHHLKNPSNQQEFTKAESCGLCLRKIVYKKEGEL